MSANYTLSSQLKPSHSFFVTDDKVGSHLCRMSLINFRIYVQPLSSIKTFFVENARENNLQIAKTRKHCLGDATKQY